MEEQKYNCFAQIYVANYGIVKLVANVCDKFRADGCKDCPYAEKASD